jgi:hypothetical protein
VHGSGAPDRGERTQEVHAHDPGDLSRGEATGLQGGGDVAGLVEPFDSAWPYPGRARVVPLVVAVEVVLFLPLVGEVQAQADVLGPDECTTAVSPAVLAAWISATLAATRAGRSGSSWMRSHCSPSSGGTVASLDPGLQPPAGPARRAPGMPGGRWPWSAVAGSEHMGFPVTEQVLVMPMQASRA